MAIATVSQMCCWRRWAAGCPSSQRRFQVFQSSSNRSAMVYSSRQTTRRRLRRPWKGSWPTLNCALGWHGRRESRSRSASRLITAPNSCSLFSCLLREVKRFVRDPRSQYGPRHPDTAGGVGSAGARRTSSPESALAGQGTQGGGGSAGETSCRKEVCPRNHGANRGRIAQPVRQGVCGRLLGCLSADGGDRASGLWSPGGVLHSSGGHLLTGLAAFTARESRRPAGHGIVLVGR